MRRLTLPKTLDEYKVEPSAAFKPPEGVEFTLNQSDPQVANLKAWALKNGVPQAELSGLVDIYGGLVASQQQTYKAAKDAEIAKLGTAGPSVVDSISTWLDAKGYGAFKPMMVTADIIRGFQKLMADTSSQGASHYTGNGRDTGQSDGKIVGYEKMNFAQRRQAQDQARQQRGGL